MFPRNLRAMAYLVHLLIICNCSVFLALKWATNPAITKDKLVWKYEEESTIDLSLCGQKDKKAKNNMTAQSHMVWQKNGSYWEDDLKEPLFPQWSMSTLSVCAVLIKQLIFSSSHKSCSIKMAIHQSLDMQLTHMPASKRIVGKKVVSDTVRAQYLPNRNMPFPMPSYSSSSPGSKMKRLSAENKRRAPLGER